MMNIKIEFRGKVHKLGPGLKSLNDIHRDIQIRYPNCFKSGIVMGFVENNALITLQNFEHLCSMVQKMQGGSLKLKVFEGKDLPSNEVDISSSQYSSRKGSNDETNVYQVINIQKIDKYADETELFMLEKKQVISETEDKTLHIVSDALIKEELSNQKVEKFNPIINQKLQSKNEVINKKSIDMHIGKHYICYHCRGGGSLSTDMKCPICEGLGRIEEGHPLITFVDEILNDRLKIMLQKYHIGNIEEPKRKSPEKKEVAQPTEIKLIDFRKKMSVAEYSFKFCESPENRVKGKCNQQFLWSTNIINSGNNAWPRRVYVYRMRNDGQYEEIYELNGIMHGQKINVTIGFKAQKKNAVEMFNLRLGYVDLYEGVVFFGPKFGFEVDTTELQPVQKLRDMEDLIRNKIQQACKFIPNQRHSITYLLIRIKDLKMAEDTSIEVLTDIIASLQ